MNFFNGTIPAGAPSGPDLGLDVASGKLYLTHPGIAGWQAVAGTPDGLATRSVAYSSLDAEFPNLLASSDFDTNSNLAFMTKLGANDGATAQGAVFATDLSGVQNVAGLVFGFSSYSAVGGTMTGTSTAIWASVGAFSGIRGSVNLQGSNPVFGTPAGLAGVLAWAEWDSTGHCGILASFYALNATGSAGSADISCGFAIGDMQSFGAITAGIYIASQTNAANYAIYSAGGKNHFAGTVRVNGGISLGVAAAGLNAIDNQLAFVGLSGTLVGMYNSNVLTGATATAYYGSYQDSPILGGGSTVATAVGHFIESLVGVGSAANYGLKIGDFGAGANDYAIHSAGGKVHLSLPTVDPHVVGVLWANAGVVTVSAG